MAPDSVDAQSQPVWLRSLYFAAAFGALVWLGRLTHLPSGMALVWPAAGIGALWLWDSWSDRRVLAADIGALWLLASLLNVVTGFNWSSSVWFGVINVVQSVVIAAILRRWYPHRLEVSRVLDVGRLGLACVVGCASVTVILLPLVIAVYPVPFEQHLAIMLAYVLRNITGAFLVISCGLLVSGPDARVGIRADLRKAELLAVLGLMVLVWFLGAVVPGVPMGLLLQLAVLWAAVRLAPATTALVVGLTSMELVAWSVTDRGPLGGMATDAGAAILQGQLVVIGAMGLFVALIQAERAQMTAERDEVAGDRTRLSARLDESQEMLRRGFEDAPMAMLTVELPAPPSSVQALGSAQVRCLNSGALGLLGADGSGPAGRLHQVIHRDDLRHVATLLSAAAVGEEPPPPRDVTVNRADGSQLLCEIRAAVVRSAGDQDAPEDCRITLLVMLNDVTAQRRAKRSLDLHLLQDALTGLASRVLFEDRLQHALAASTRTQGKVGVLSLDLQGFRTVNSTHGRTAGDDLLVQVGSRMASVIRPGDTAARFNADDFALVCPETSQAGLYAVAERLRELLSRPYRVRTDDGAVTVVVGVHIGGACATGGGATASRDLLRRADIALTVAQTPGRSPVVIDDAMTSSITPGVGPR